MCLNSQGHRTKTWVSTAGKLNQGKAFNKNLIRYILKNPIYAGKIAHKGELYQGKHQPIIAPKIWDKVQTMFSRTEDKVTKSVSRVSTVPLLKGLLYCDCCNSKMTPTYCSKKNGIRYRYYSCSSKMRGIHERCKIKSISAAEIEEIVIAKVLQILKSPEIVTQAISKASSENANEGQKLSDSQIIKALQDTSKIWNELFPVEQSRITKMFISQVILKEDGLDIQIYNEGLNLLTEELTQEAA